MQPPVLCTADQHSTLLGTVKYWAGVLVWILATKSPSFLLLTWTFIQTCLVDALVLSQMKFWFVFCTKVFFECWCSFLCCMSAAPNTLYPQYPQYNLLKSDRRFTIYKKKLPRSKNIWRVQIWNMLWTPQGHHSCSKSLQHSQRREKE